MIAALRRLWPRHDHRPAPAPDPAFVREVREAGRYGREQAVAAVHARRELKADARRECPLVGDVFHDPPRRAGRQEP